MADKRMPWFRCYPTKLLGALAGMLPHEGYVYWIVCLRIYETGKPCRDTVEALARRTGFSKKLVREALDLCFQATRLTQTDAGITNPFALEVMAEADQFRENRSDAGKRGASKTWEKRKEKQQKTDGKAMPEPMANSSHLQRESLFSDENRAMEPVESDAPQSVAMVNPPRDPEADLYHRGKEILGPTSGGMIRNLLRVKGGNIALARAALELASTRGDAKQYIGAMVSMKRAASAGGGNGFAAVLRERHATEGEV